MLALVCCLTAPLPPHLRGAPEPAALVALLPGYADAVAGVERARAWRAEHDDEEAARALLAWEWLAEVRNPALDPYHRPYRIGQLLLYVSDAERRAGRMPEPWERKS